MSLTRREVCAAGIGVLGGVCVWRAHARRGRQATVAILSDLHVEPDRISECQEWLSRARSADMTIIAGDFCRDQATPTEWRHVSLALAGFDVEGVLGNHDWFAGGEPWKRLLMPHRYYSFGRFGVNWLMLDAGRGDGHGRGPHAIDDEQLEWITREVRNGPFIAVSHIPLLTAFDKGFGNGVYSFACTNGAEVAQIMASSGNCLMVISGHTHVRERVEALGVKQETMGAVSGDWWGRKFSPTTIEPRFLDAARRSPRGMILRLPGLTLEPLPDLDLVPVQA